MTINYPVTYRHRGWTRAAYAGLGLAPIACTGVIATIIYLQHGTDAGRPMEPVGWILLWTVGTAFVAMGLVLIATAFGCSTTFYADRLEYKWLWWTTTVGHEDIRGVRRIQWMLGCLHMTLVRDDGKKVSIAVCKPGDEILDGWFGEIPALDVVEAATEINALCDNPAFGATPQAREKAINRQSRLIGILDWFSRGGLVWALFSPSTFPIVIMISVPPFLLLLVALSGGRWKLTSGKALPRLSLAQLTVGPIRGPAYIVTVTMQLPFGDWVQLGCATMGAAIVCTVLVCLVERHVAVKSTSTVFICCLVYDFSLVTVADMRLPQPPGRVVPVQVTEVETGKSAGLAVTGLGPGDEESKFAAPRSLVNSSKPGDTVCVTAHEGALEIVWYRLDQCGPAEAQHEPPPFGPVPPIDPAISYLKVKWQARVQEKPFPAAYFTTTPVVVDTWMIEEDVVVSPADLTGLSGLSDGRPCLTGTAPGDYLQIVRHRAGVPDIECRLDHAPACAYLQAMLSGWRVYNRRYGLWIVADLADRLDCERGRV